MKTIEQHERERGARQPKYCQPNGISCPRCTRELRDVNPNIILTTNPPRKVVICVGCNWTGYVTA